MPSRRVLVTGGSGFIGTHLVEAVTAAGGSCLNLDRRPPALASQRDGWHRVDLLDESSLQREVAAFRPTHVVHLAARTDTSSDRLDDYRDNTAGTESLLRALERHAEPERVVITSSQFVVGPGAPPRGDEDFRPHTVYGQSKVLTEKMTRRSSLRWTLVRPTNIWGPWHPRYPGEFWQVLRRGLYVHPGRRPVMRCYGYVGNVVQQTLRLLELPEAEVLERVFYLGDAPVELLRWADGFSRAIAGRPVRVAPRVLVRGLALFGDLLGAAGARFPIHSSRFRSMTEDYVVPMDATFAALGAPPISIERGIEETVSWLDTQGFFGVAGRPPARCADGAHPSPEAPTSPEAPAASESV